MDVRVQRLAQKLDRDIAQKLVSAGYTTPRKIKAATDKDLLLVPDIGRGSVAAIRKVFPAA